MMLYPDFYADFACRAADCRHSCCKGWEIDVDEPALRRYAAVEGDLGQELRRNIYQDDDGAHFILTEDERCPFLRGDGLCRLIVDLGEGALCEICALHPRFFTDVGENTLCGLGLSCEAACDLLLNSDAPLCVVSETGERIPVPALLGLSGDALRFDGALPSAAYLRRELKTLPTGARYDRMLQYILLRQLDRAGETALERLIGYARDSAAFIAAQDALFGTDAEHLRRWSEQIEYSTENVDILLG